MAYCGPTKIVRKKIFCEICLVECMRDESWRTEAHSTRVDVQKNYAWRALIKFVYIYIYIYVCVRVCACVCVCVCVCVHNIYIYIYIYIYTYIHMYQLNKYKKTRRPPYWLDLFA